MNDNKKMFYPAFISVLLIIAFILIGKNTDIAHNLFINNSIIVFPLIFLLTGYMIHSIGSKLVKKSINYSIIIFIIFLVILIIASIFRSNEATYYYRASFEFILTPKHTKIFGISFAYPDLIKTVFFIASYYISLLIFTTLYRSVKDYSPKVISFLISYLIAYVLKEIIYVGGTRLIMIFNNEIVFHDLIVSLTSFFVGAMITTLISTIVYLFICIRLKNKDIVLFKNIS